MSCVVGIVRNKAVWIGGDRFTPHDGAAGEKAEPKVAMVGPFLIGAVGGGRYGQVIRHCFRPPARRRRGGDLLAYLAGDFADALSETLDSRGLIPAYRIDQRMCALIGADGRLFTLHPDMHVVEQARGYDAIGSGARQALGALHLATYTDLPPREQVAHALEAAAALASSVRPPFDIRSIPRSKS